MTHHPTVIVLRSSLRVTRARRGSVIVLVVAVLALLAVIGTVYIISSRTERTSANASAVAENLDLAQKAVNEQIVQMIGESTFDGQGEIAGGSTASGPFGAILARRYDIPEINVLNPGFNNHNAFARDQSWLVTNLYRPTVNTLPFSDLYYNDLTAPQSRVVIGSGMSPSVFNPSTGQFDINVYNPVSGVASAPVLSGLVGAFQVVSDILPTGPQNFGNYSSTVGPDAFIQLLPFSEANGTRYRFGLRIIDTSRMANLNVGSTSTVLSNDLMQGTRYNGYLLSTSTIFDPVGTQGAPNDVPGNLNVNGVGNAGLVSNLGRFGTYNPAVAPVIIPGAPLPSNEYITQQTMFRAESPFVSAYSGWDNKLISPFDLSDELALRSLGILGTLAQPRASAIWFNTLSNVNTANLNNPNFNFHRANYTNYSYSRDLRAYPDPVVGFPTYTVTGLTTGFPSLGYPVNAGPGNPIYVWPPKPARIAAMPDIATYTHRYVGTNPSPNKFVAAQDLASDELVIAATNIATAMEIPASATQVYDQSESRAFAANYLTYRWPSWAFVRQEMYKGNNVNVYNMPNGPSFIDSSGICLRGDGGYSRDYGSSPTDLNSTTLTKVFLGYAAQPFINEVAANIKDNAGAPQWVDCAVELYNPYNVALDLGDFELILDNNPPISLSGQWIPPRGYFVITQNAGGTLDALVFNDEQTRKMNSLSLSFNGISKIYLMRKYFPRGGGLPLWGAVDGYGVTAFATFTPAMNEDKKVFLYRDNSEVPYVAPSDPSYPTYRNYQPRWLAALHSTTSEALHIDTTMAPNRLSLGASNDNDGTIPNVVPLYDRFIESDRGNTASPVNREPLDNITDFNRIMRRTNEIDTAAVPSGSYVANGALTLQLSTLIDQLPGAFGASVDNTELPADAGIHFDFKFAPGLYSNPVTLPTTYKPGDLRAAQLLEYLTLVDRVSDYTINLGDQNPIQKGLSKLRIPGQINVNTASAEVLATIPILNVPANRPIIGLILAYRYRTLTNDPRIPLACQFTTPVIDFSNDPNRLIPPFNPNYADFPGYGIRSLGELMIPLHYFNPAPSSLYDRDQVWGILAASLTVRSDTFVAYAYLEGVRQNPRYSGVFNNNTHWYLNDATAISDDPNDSTHPLIRVARRRWVAIVDRSQSNYSRLMINPNGPIPPTVPNPNFTLPRIVAQKDMPR